MQNYTNKPKQYIDAENSKIAVFTDTDSDQNLDQVTVNSFGEEWTKFDNFTDEDIKKAGDQYFDIVGDDVLNKDTYVMDLGCGTGRWTKYIQDKVGLVEAVDPSVAVIAAAGLLKDCGNVRITKASVDELPFVDNSFDLIVCLGVLHHIPNTKKALVDSVKKLKPGGKYLLYLYYALDNRGIIFRSLFSLAHLVRIAVSHLPSFLKKLVCDLIAILIYMPFILLAKLLLILFPKSQVGKKIPLSYYHDKNFKIIRNDALDRFGTPLEQRFTKKEIEFMMKEAELSDIVFSENEPYWHAVGTKK